MTDQQAVAIAAHVVRLRRLDCCAISDALDTLKLPGVVSGLLPRTGFCKIVGRVTTVRLGVIDAPRPGPVKHLGCTAIEMCGPDDVIVVEQNTGIDAGGWGGTLSLAAKLRRIAGAVIDGPARDIDESTGCGFPVFSRTTTAFTARGRIGELGTNVPVTVGSVTVHAGDYLIGDTSGVAFIPAARFDEICGIAEAIVDKETLMKIALLDGIPVGQVMGANYENMLSKGTS